MKLDTPGADWNSNEISWENVATLVAGRANPPVTPMTVNSYLIKTWTCDVGEDCHFR